jgi:transposase
VAIDGARNGNAIVKLIAPRAARLVISNPKETLAIAEAEVNTNRVDATILAQVSAADCDMRFDA